MYRTHVTCAVPACAAAGESGSTHSSRTAVVLCAKGSAERVERGCRGYHAAVP